MWSNNCMVQYSRLILLAFFKVCFWCKIVELLPVWFGCLPFKPISHHTRLYCIESFLCIILNAQSFGTSCSIVPIRHLDVILIKRYMEATHPHTLKTTCNGKLYKLPTCIPYRLRWPKWLHRVILFSLVLGKCKLYLLRWFSSKKYSYFLFWKTTVQNGFQLKTTFDYFWASFSL